MEAATFKAIAAVLAETKEAAVAAAVQTVLAPANAICRGILKGALHYVGNEFGYMDTKVGFVSYKTFSGTEQLVCFTAIALGLTALSPCRIAIMDELARLDEANLAKIVVNIIDAVRERQLDQAIVVLPDGKQAQDLVTFAAQQAAIGGVEFAHIQMA